MPSSFTISPHGRHHRLRLNFDSKFSHPSMNMPDFQRKVKNPAKAVGCDCHPATLCDELSKTEPVEMVVIINENMRS